MQHMRVTEIDRRDAADAFGVNIRRHDALAESQRRKNRQLGARVEAIDIRGRIGLRVTSGLRLRQHLREIRAALFDLREDVIASPVQNSVKRVDAVAGNSFAQHGVNRNAAGHARLHRQIDVGRDGLVPQLRAAQRHQFLVRRHHRFPFGSGGFDHLARHTGAADELGDDVDVRMIHHLAPIRSLQRRP